jgi:DNA-directed RNA polymerase subunit H (RpoH/RPB5)
MIEYCIENEIHQMILPLCLGHTPYAYKEMETVRMDESVFIELFSYDELQRRVAQQELVPQYQLLRPAEVDRVLKRYRCSSIYRLPRIGEADMASRYYGFKKGDVVEERTTIGGCQTPLGYYVIVRL